MNECEKKFGQVSLELFIRRHRRAPRNANILPLILEAPLSPV